MSVSDTETSNWKSGQSYRQERPHSARNMRTSACVIKQRTIYCNYITSSIYRSAVHTTISSHVLVARVLHGGVLENHFYAHVQRSPHPAVYCTAHWYYIISINIIIYLSVMELGHLLTRSGLTYPEVSSKVCHDFFCQLGNSVSLPWLIYYEAFYSHVVSSFSYIPVICLKLVLFLIPLQFVHLFCK